MPTADSLVQLDYSPAAKAPWRANRRCSSTTNGCLRRRFPPLPVGGSVHGRDVSAHRRCFRMASGRAVAAARAAFDDGRGRTCLLNKRERIINKLADLIEAHVAEFAELRGHRQMAAVGMATMIDIPGAVDQLSLHGGLGVEAGWRVDRAPGNAPRRGVQLCDARTCRRRGANRTLEFPPVDGER